MAQNSRPTSILQTLGEEIIKIIAPVSICMFMVVILVTVLNADPSSSSVTVSSIATMAYDENDSDSFWDKFLGAVLNSLVFVGVITVATFILVFLFYLRCTKFLKIYMGFSAFTVLGFMGGEIALFLIRDFSIPIDCVTFLVVLFNFSVVGVLAVFLSKMPIIVTQAYLVFIGILVAYWFTLLPEWTTWALLIALALYDLAAVLLPVGPLRLLVELAISRDEDIPALVYEARPVTYNGSDTRNVMVQRRLWRNTNSSSETTSSLDANSVLSVNEHSGLNFNSNTSDNSESRLNASTYTVGISLVRAEEGCVPVAGAELSAPLIDNRVNVQQAPPGQEDDALLSENMMLEGIGLGTSGAIKLGLGDFIFYSVLVGRAAMYDFMTVYACYLAIVAGLGITLLLLALYQKALPALPVSIALEKPVMFPSRYFGRALFAAANTGTSPAAAAQMIHNPLEQFFEVDRSSDDNKPVVYGRSWKASELRLKSWDDLQKFWHVLLREKNMLLTQRQMLQAQNI